MQVWSKAERRGDSCFRVMALEEGRPGRQGWSPIRKGRMAWKRQSENVQEDAEDELAMGAISGELRGLGCRQQREGGVTRPPKVRNRKRCSVG